MSTEQVPKYQVCRGVHVVYELIHNYANEDPIELCCLGCFKRASDAKNIQCINTVKYINEHIRPQMLKESRTLKNYFGQDNKVKSEFVNNQSELIKILSHMETNEEYYVSYVVFQYIK